MTQEQANCLVTVEAAHRVETAEAQSRSKTDRKKTYENPQSHRNVRSFIPWPDSPNCTPSRILSRCNVWTFGNGPLHHPPGPFRYGEGEDSVFPRNALWRRKRNAFDLAGVRPKRPRGRPGVSHPLTRPDSPKHTNQHEHGTRNQYWRRGGDYAGQQSARRHGFPHQYRDGCAVHPETNHHSQRAREFAAVLPRDFRGHSAIGCPLPVVFSQTLTPKQKHI